jgi:hypothetical protein
MKMQPPARSFRYPPGVSRSDPHGDSRGIARAAMSDVCPSLRDLRFISITLSQYVLVVGVKEVCGG